MPHVVESNRSSLALGLLRQDAEPAPSAKASSTKSPQRGLRSFVLLGLILLGVCQSGCMHRRLTIRTNPPGAVVKIDEVEVGTTPVSTEFLYYGNRKIQIVKDGYETLTVLQPVPAPWYQRFGLDFFSDNFALHEIHDHRFLDYRLQPMIHVPTEELMQRAEQLRQAGHNQPVVPPVGPGAPSPLINPPIGLSPESVPPPGRFNTQPPAGPPPNFQPPINQPGPYPLPAPNAAPPRLPSNYRLPN